MRTLPLLASLLIVSSSACDDDASPGTDTTSADTTEDVSADATDTNVEADSAPSDDSATADDAATSDADTSAPPSDPIVEREGTVTRTCSETLAPTQADPSQWFTIAAFDVDGAPWVLRTANFSELSVAALEDDADVGTSYALGEVVNGVNQGAASVSGTVVTLVWAEFDGEGGQVLKHAVVDTASGVTMAPTTLPGTSSRFIGGPVLAPRGDTLGLVWSDTLDVGGTKLRFAQVGATGFVTTPVDVVALPQPIYQGLAPGIVSVGTGFGVTWSQMVGDDYVMFEPWFVLIDPAGVKAYAPKRISPAAGSRVSWGTPWYSGSRDVIAVGGDVWVVVSEEWSEGGFEDPHGYVDLHVAVVDAATGDSVLHPLNRRVDNRRNEQAVLFAFDDQVGITWVAGTAIYICAGCFVDYDIHVLLIDPETMTPSSNLAVHTHHEHGYARPRSAVSGALIKTIAQQDYHALNYPVLSIMECALE